MATVNVTLHDLVINLAGEDAADDVAGKEDAEWRLNFTIETPGGPVDLFTFSDNSVSQNDSFVFLPDDTTLANLEVSDTLLISASGYEVDGVNTEPLPEAIERIPIRRFTEGDTHAVFVESPQIGDFYYDFVFNFAWFN